MSMIENEDEDLVKDALRFADHLVAPAIAHHKILAKEIRRLQAKVLLLETTIKDE